MINLQSPGPLGLGELANLPDGNSILTLKDKNGQSVNHKLWINDFTSDLNMEIDTTQLRSGYSYRPIRIQERVLTFTTIWSLANRPKYEALVEAIREHWAYNFNELVPTPAYFTYFGANKTFAGFILNAERSYAVPDTLLSYSFDMKLMTSNVNEYVSEVSMYSYYIPRPDSIKINGIDGWYAGTDLLDVVTQEDSKNNSNTTDSSTDFLLGRKRGVLYVSPEDAPSTSTDTSSTSVENLRAAVIYYLITVGDSSQANAIDQADEIMEDTNPDYRDSIWMRVKDQNWEQYLGL